MTRTEALLALGDALDVFRRARTKTTETLRILATAIRKASRTSDRSAVDVACLILEVERAREAYEIADREETEANFAVVLATSRWRAVLAAWIDGPRQAAERARVIAEDDWEEYRLQERERAAKTAGVYVEESLEAPDNGEETGGE
jgi:hypothetical protein